MADEYTRRLASQFAVDRTQIDNRRILGDDLARLREVEHFAYLPSEHAAQDAIQRLERVGFSCSSISYGDTHALCAVRSDAIDEESARYFVREVTAIVTDLGGGLRRMGCARGQHASPARSRAGHSGRHRLALSRTSPPDCGCPKSDGDTRALAVS